MPGERPILYANFTHDGIHMSHLGNVGLISNLSDLPALREDIIEACATKSTPIAIRLHKEIFTDGPLHLFQPVDNKDVHFLIPVPEKRRSHIPDVQMALTNHIPTLHLITEKRKPLFIATYSSDSLSTADLSWDSANHKVVGTESLKLAEGELAVLQLGSKTLPLIFIENSGNGSTDYEVDVVVHPHILNVVKY